MKDKIKKIIQQTPGLKGREIAKRIGVDKKEVNSFLDAHRHLFIQDGNYGWSMIDQFRIVFPRNAWVNSDSFEETLGRHGSPLEDARSSVIFVLPEGCKMLLGATTRLLALCNQLAWKGKHIFLDFTDNGSTLSYLNRNGFFDHLSTNVVVLPERPAVSGAKIYQGNADTLMEFRAINLLSLDEMIPYQLRYSFVKHAGEEYSQPIFTVLAELFNNVRDHSESPISGVAALQIYKGTKWPHIQTVISDSGSGIIGTLKPILHTRYPEVARKIAKHGEAADAYLVKEMFEKGRITQCEPGRGIGLKASGDVAAKFNATISIRQETFEVTLKYTGEKQPEFSYELNRPRIFGTHICVDFPLDRKHKISLN